MGRPPGGLAYGTFGLSRGMGLNRLNRKRPLWCVRAPGLSNVFVGASTTSGRAVYTLQLYSLHSHLPPETGCTGFDWRPTAGLGRKLNRAH